MARTNHAAKNPPHGYPDLPLTANGADITFSAVADAATTKDECDWGANVILLFQNSGASPYTVTINSAEDPEGRTGDITAYSLGAGEFAAFGPFPAQGWRQSDGKLYFEGSNVAVKVAVLRLGS